MSWNRIVDLYLLLDQKSGSPLLESLLGGQALEQLEMVQGDTFRLRIWTVKASGATLTPPIPTRLSEDTYLVFSGKPVTSIGTDESLFKAEGFVEVEAEEGVWYYEAILTLDTDELNAACAALGATVRTLQVAIDLENANGANTERLTKQFDATIRRQVYSGTSNPVPAEAGYPAAGNLLLGSSIRTLTVPDGDDHVDFVVPDTSSRWSILGIIAPNEDAAMIGVVDLVRIDDTTIRARLTAATAEDGYKVSIYAHTAIEQEAEPIIESDIYTATITSGQSTVDITIPAGDRRIIPLGVETPAAASGFVTITGVKRLNTVTARLTLSGAPASAGYEASIYVPLRNP